MIHRSRPTSFRTVLERSADGATLRRRIGALGGCGALLIAIASTFGYGVVFAAALAVVVAAAVLLRALRRWRRAQWPTRAGVVAAPPAAGEAVRTALAPFRRGSRRLAGEVARAALTAFRKGCRRLAGEALWAILATARTATVHAGRLRRARRVDVGERGTMEEAMRLNALGVRLRRQGEPRRALACHEEALTILDGLGERRAAALTRNEIALALERAGQEDEALAHFEEAIWTLRSLEEPEREGQVLANLAATHLRSGRDEEAGELFEAALDRVGDDPEVRAKIERQLELARGG